MSTPTPLGFSPHDHTACVSRALRAAESHCAEQSLQFTKSRRRVLEILLHEHKALGAYDILAKLTSEGAAAQPPAAYRALEFLVRHGFAHKIEKRNAYIACALPGHAHDPAFLICRTCDHVAEEAQQAPLSQAARASGFRIERSVIEAEGLCSQCQDAAT